jgi:hypothetical protein
MNQRLDFLLIQRRYPSQTISARQAGLDAERERLDTSALERLKKDESGKMLSKIKDFFGLAK